MSKKCQKISIKSVFCLKNTIFLGKRLETSKTAVWGSRTPENALFSGNRGSGGPDPLRVLTKIPPKMKLVWDFTGLEILGGKVRRTTPRVTKIPQ